VGPPRNEGLRAVSARFPGPSCCPWEPAIRENSYFWLVWIPASDRYAAIWEKTSGPAWQAYHGLSSTQYQSTIDSLKAQGYRPVLVNGYSVGGVDYYVAIFHYDSFEEMTVPTHGGAPSFLVRS
jgi:hypothetical protein